MCLNVATYGPGARFTMTDRGREALATTPDCLSIGPSSMRWGGGRLVLDVNERGAPPGFGRVRGRVTVTPRAITSVELPLTPDGAHVWRPFAPVSDIEVDMEAPDLHWKGHGYLDANFGTRPLEADFRFWSWGRFPAAGGATCIYDAERRDGTRLESAFAFTPEGGARAVAAPPRTRFRNSFWGLRRETRADPGTMPRPALDMLDAPFYARTAVTTRLDGETVTGIHEALDLDRFASRLIKPMLAIRVPRRARWPG